MATRSSIAYEREDGTIVSSYCHFDGYLQSVGAQLVLNYSEAEKVEDLVVLGSMSYLRDKIHPSVGSTHSFETPEAGVTVFYHRDRGELWSHTAPTVYDSFDAWFEANDQEYNYLYVDGTWQCHTSSTFIRDIANTYEVKSMLKDLV
jgi:hypothetical protein